MRSLLSPYPSTSLSSFSPPSRRLTSALPQFFTGTFIADQIKGFALSLALEIPIIAGVLWIIEWVGAAGMLRIVAWIMAFM